MGTALAKRWRVAFPSAALHVVDPNTAKRTLLESLGCTVHGKLDAAMGPVDVLVLAVKPQQYAALLHELSAFTLAHAPAPLVISVMAGVPLSALAPLSPQVARIMPNTPALIGEGTSAICAPGLSDAQQQLVKTLFEATGRVVMIGQEEQMHAVTAISGSGPAYLFAFMEAFEQAAIDLGVDAVTAHGLVMQTIRGAALLADQSSSSPAELRAQVTSPGGTTEAALAELAKADLQQVMLSVLKAAEARSRALSE